MTMNVDIVSERQRVLDEAHSWIGTPYHHAARKKGVGVDCAQLLIAVYQNAGIHRFSEPEAYPPDWMTHRNDSRFLAWISDWCITVETPEAGDVALFRYGRGPSHGAIMIDKRYMIHSYSISRRVEVREIDFMIERLAGYWSPKRWHP